MQKLVRGLKHLTRIQCSWTFIFIKYNMWKPSPRPHCSPCTSYCMTFTRANMATLPVIYEDYVSQCWVWSLGRNLDDWMSKRSNTFHNNFAHASHFFVHFFAITEWLRHESAQFYVLWRENTRQWLSFFFSLNFDRVFRIQLQKNVFSDEWAHEEGRNKYFDSTRYNTPWVLGQGHQR